MAALQFESQKGRYPGGGIGYQDVAGDQEGNPKRNAASG